jgi:NodT family efflux transporter outer membrane factor (OMF) lipoprotein
MHTLSRALGGLAAAALTSTLLAGCVVGPDYEGPPHPAPLAEGAKAFHRQAGAGVVEAPVAARWWTSLKDPELDRLIDAGLAQSPDLKAAEARLRQSRALLGGARAAQLPSVGANAGVIAADGLSLPGSGSNHLTLYNAGFDATWELDLFGGQRRSVEQAAASAQAVQADLEDVKVSLAAEIARVYIQLRDQQQRHAITAASADLEARLVALAQERRSHGVGSELDLERLRGQLEATRASLIPIGGQITESLDQLAVLTGREPGALDAELAAAAPLPDLPAVVPVDDPAQMMRRRPDIRAAERRLAAQNAVIGERTADLFPKLNLLGFIGWGSTDLTRLFDSTTSVAAPMLQWNAVDFGRTRARIREADAGRDLAAAQYDKTVLNALDDAETALSRLGRARQSVVALARVEASAARAAQLTRQRQKAGVASVIDVLDTERTRLQAEDELAGARAQLVQAYVALQKSLGLGWQDAQA